MHRIIPLILITAVLFLLTFIPFARRNPASTNPPAVLHVAADGAAVIPNHATTDRAVHDYVLPQTFATRGTATGGALPAQQAPIGLRRIGGSTDGVHQTLANKGSGVGIAVLDTGIDLAHPDLGGVISGTNCIDKKKDADDDNGHGTHVAGTIAARDNTQGTVGVAPAATLYAVKVLDSNGMGSLSALICGIDWVTEHADVIKVANMSLSRPGSATRSNPDCSNANSDALHVAICRSVKAGVTYIVSAGNGAVDVSTLVPAAYEEVIPVSALADSDGKPNGRGPRTCTGDADDAIANFSNFGEGVAMIAPGVCILSTWPGAQYRELSGPSTAAPYVAGAAALYIATNPDAAPEQVRQSLLEGEAVAWNPPGHPSSLGTIVQVR